MVGALSCSARAATSHATAAEAVLYNSLRPSQKRKSSSWRAALLGERPVYARNAENHFGLSGGVREPAGVGRGRSRCGRCEGCEECAFGEAAGPGLCGAGDDHAGAHSLARALSVARSAGRPRDRPARRRHRGRIHRHAVCRIWTEAGRRPRNVHAEGAAGRDHDAGGDAVFSGSEAGRGDESEAARRIRRLRPDAAGAVGCGCGHRFCGLRH